MNYRQYLKKIKKIYLSIAYSGARVHSLSVFQIRSKRKKW